MAGLDKVATLQRDSTAAAERIQQSEKLLQQVEACGKVLDALLSISLIEMEAAAEAMGDPDVLTARMDAKFLVARSRILAATHQLPSGLLPKTAIVANFPRLNGSEKYLADARKEVTE